MVRERSEGESLLSDSVAIVHFGGLGDVVLLSEVVARYRAADPNLRLTVFCRQEFAPAAEAYAVPADEIVGVPFDPYGPRPVPEVDAAARAFFASRPRPSLLVTPEIARTWLTELAIDSFAPAAVVSPRGGEAQPVGARELMTALSPEGRTERPRLHVDETLRERVRVAAAARGVVRPLAVFPFGEARVPWKRWPLERYAELLRRVARATGTALLLVGNRAEAESLEGLRERLGDLCVVDIVAGEPRDLAEVFARISLARGFVGNDTGLSHAACALGVPGVTIFGGGNWPHYAPWANGHVGVVGPLPCFGCAWHCAFDRGICVERIDVVSVERALAEALAAPHGPPRVVSLETVTGLESDVIGRAAQHVRATEVRAEILQSVANDRLNALVETAKLAVTVDELGRAAGERLTELEHARGRAEMLEIAASERLASLNASNAENLLMRAHLEGALSDARAAQASAEAHRAAAAERLDALESVSVQLATWQKRALAFEQAARERLESLIAAGAAAESARAAFECESRRLLDRISTLEAEVALHRDAAASLFLVAEERLQALERSSAEAAAAARSHAEDRENSTQSRHESERTSADRVSRLEAELLALADRVRVAERAAVERLDALLRTSGELQRVSEEAERRSVLIAELTSLVAAQQHRLTAYVRRPDKR